MKLKCLLLALALITIANNAFARGHRSQDLVGEWVNVDPQTRGVTGMLISLDESGLGIQAWGRCHPRDCEWGRVELRRVGTSVEDTSFDRGFAVWDPGFAVTYVTLWVKDDRLIAETITIFKDRSRRSNYRAVHVLRRAESDPESSLPNTRSVWPEKRTSATTPNAYQEIEQLEIEWNAINERSDPDGKRRLLTDDSYHVGPSGRLYNKAADVAAARTSREQKLVSNAVTRFIIEDRRIRLYDDVAVVTGTGASVVSRNAEERPGSRFRFVHVWEKRDGRWQLSVDQVTGVKN